jgi:hypothetical protein
MKTLIKKSLVPTCSLLAIVANGCGSHTSGADTSGTTTELAAQTVGGAVSSTNADTIAMGDSNRNTTYAKLMRQISPISEAFAGAFGVCPTIIGGAGGGACSLNSDAITLTFPTDGCTYGGVLGPIWLGGTTVTVASPQSGFQCGGTYPELNSTDTSLKRTYLGALGANPTSVTNYSGTHTVVVDTSAPTASTFESAATASPTSGTIGWDYSIPTGSGYTRTFVSSTNHELAIAVRLVGYEGSSTSGTLIFDHTLSTTNSAGTSSPLSIERSGSGLSATETVNGTLYLQHNLMKMTASSEFTNVEHEVGCCYPISGSITTTFKGGSNDGLQETLSFSAATCELNTLGQATFTDVNGAVSTKTLDHCF